MRISLVCQVYVYLANHLFTQQLISMFLRFCFWLVFIFLRWDFTVFSYVTGQSLIHLSSNFFFGYLSSFFSPGLHFFFLFKPAVRAYKLDILFSFFAHFSRPSSVLSVFLCLHVSQVSIVNSWVGPVLFFKCSE